MSINYFINQMDKNFILPSNFTINNYNNILNINFRNKLMTSRVMKRNPVKDDIIDDLYSKLDDLEFLFKSKNYITCIEQTTEFLIQLKDKSFINVQYDKYEDDERFIKIDKEGNRIHYLPEIDFDIFLREAKQYNYTILDLYKDSYYILIQSFIFENEYQEALLKIQNLINWKFCKEYRWLKLYSIIMYNIDKNICIDICKKILNLEIFQPENIIDNLDLYCNNIILLIKSNINISPEYVLAGKQLIKDIINKFNINLFDHKDIFINMNKLLIECYLLLNKPKKAEKISNYINLIN